MKVKLLRKLRTQARKKYIVKQVGNEFWVMYLFNGNYILCTGPRNPAYRKKCDAIARCNNERRRYILSKIERKVY